MQNSPFRLIDVTSAKRDSDADSAYLRAAELCCRPAGAPPRVSRSRTRLVELDSHLHCSIIGTCLSTTELRRLVPRFTDLGRENASDLQIHHAAVELAIQGGAGCKALQKALDERYAGALRRFDKAKDSAALMTLWRESLASGDIPAGYWAAMTHPQATLETRQAAFGEVHMLSHLVGAANRADIRRLMALEEENAALKEKSERQQRRLQEMSAERDQAQRSLAHHLEDAAKPSHRADVDRSELEAELARLKEALANRDERLALHTSRREAAEQRAIDEHARGSALGRQLDEAVAVLQALGAECTALEQALVQKADHSGARRVQLDHLAGKRIVYVGGRPGSNAAIKQIVETAGGELLVHDGGIEDRKGMFAAALPNADLVVFPVDCIDHDSMGTIKRVCVRHQVSYFPVRTASVASFVELITRLSSTKDANADAASSSRFCMRHG